MRGLLATCQARTTDRPTLQDGTRGHGTRPGFIPGVSSYALFSLPHSLQRQKKEQSYELLKQGRIGERAMIFPLDVTAVAALIASIGTALTTTIGATGITVCSACTARLESDQVRITGVGHRLRIKPSAPGRRGLSVLIALGVIRLIGLVQRHLLRRRGILRLSRSAVVCLTTSRTATLCV